MKGLAHRPEESIPLRSVRPAPEEGEGDEAAPPPRSRTRTRRPAARARFSRDQIEEIKTTGKLVLYIVGSALLVIGCFLWFSGVIPSGEDKLPPSAPEPSPQASDTGQQADGDAVLLRARAQQACDEGNQDACKLLQQPDPLDAIGDAPAPARKQQ